MAMASYSMLRLCLDMRCDISFCLRRLLDAKSVGTSAEKCMQQMSTMFFLCLKRREGWSATGDIWEGGQIGTTWVDWLMGRRDPSRLGPSTAMLRQKTPELPIILNRRSVILVLQKTPNRELGSRSASLTPCSSKVIHQEITKCSEAYKDIFGWRDTSDSALFDLGIPRWVGILEHIGRSARVQLSVLPTPGRMCDSGPSL